MRNKPAKPLKAYSERELNRWHQLLIRKGRRLKILGASDRHRLRIRAKRFRYMLEALTGIVPVFDPGEFRHVHRSAKRLQRTLGDLRDLKCFAKQGLPAEGDHPREHRPPGYRRQRQKLRSAAMSAYRSLRDAGAC